MTPAQGAPASVEARGLCKRFGALRALDRIDLCIGPGESVALFGPNGAGKTTLIRILGLSLRADAGSLRVAGYDPSADDVEVRRRVGVISHQSLLYDRLTVRENIEFFARLYGVPRPEERTDELLERMNLAHRADDLVRVLSHGMQRRASMARALVHDPPIVFLDEPFTGLDPHAAATLRSTLQALKQAGRTVLLVTHNLKRGLELCERWIILSRGRILEAGSSDPTDAAGFESRYFDRVAREQPVRA